MSENTKPKGFEDLKPTELYRSAIEDFAVPVEEADKNKKKVLLAALVESGVTWADYLAQHPEVAPTQEEVAAERVKEKARAGATITSADVAGDVSGSLSVEPVVEEEVVIRTAEKPKPQVREKFLIKMVRDNPVFEVRGVRFTQSHPYALVPEGMADYLLTREDGFRMATPGELREFYG